MLDSVYKETKERMHKSIVDLKNEFRKVRTGRASTSLLDDVQVDYYGAMTPLNQLASLSAPDARLITVQPWDINVIKDVEKAILKSDLGLTPSSDGKIIRITIPSLTEERRKELVKIISKMAEEHKIAIRNIRRDSNDFVKGMKKEGEIGEDEAFKAQEKIQKITDDYIEKIDNLYTEKEKEILEF
jgi:ribosome recycling factor